MTVVLCHTTPYQLVFSFDCLQLVHCCNAAHCRTSANASSVLHAPLASCWFTYHHCTAGLPISSGYLQAYYMGLLLGQCTIYLHHCLQIATVACVFNSFKAYRKCLMPTENMTDLPGLHPIQ